MLTPFSRIALVSASVFLAAALVGCARPRPAASSETVAGSPPGPAAADSCAPSRRREARHLYRLDFVLTSTEPGKPPSESTHTLHLEDDAGGEIRLGTNSPLPGGGRQDVGLLLRGSFHLVGDDMLLEAKVETSAVEEGASIRRIELRGDALLPPGKTALIASTEDPATHRRFTVTASATRLR